MSARVDDFGAKLEIALKLLNISRGRLSAEMRVDKSLVSKWLRGIVIPGGPNVAALTNLIRTQRAAFTQLNWELPLDAFAAALVATSDGQAPSPFERGPTTPGWFIPVRRQTSQEIAREGNAYPGVYVCFRQSPLNDGDIVPELLTIWRERNSLFFRNVDPLSVHVGEIFVLRHQLFLAGADHPRADDISQTLLSGVRGAKAWRLHGLMVNACNDRFGTPGASPIVAQRVADLTNPDEPPSAAALEPAMAILTQAFGERRVHLLCAPEIVCAITPLVGAPQGDGQIHRLLTIPLARSLGASEQEWTPELATDVVRLRQSLWGEQPGPQFPLELEPGAGSPT